MTLQPTSSPSSSTLHTTYTTLLHTHMPSIPTAKSVLQDPHHQLWQHIIHLIQNSSSEQLHSLLTHIYTTFHHNFNTLPSNAKPRPTPKSATRLQQKIPKLLPKHMERSACADWIACRIESDISQFDTVKQRLTQCLGHDVALVWRSEDVHGEKRDDVLEFGYAYRLGGDAVLEIQVVEPVAGWVFEMNSRGKHGGEVGCVTFGESRVLYEAIKGVILGAFQVDMLPEMGDVVAYYERVRETRRGTLDYGELRRMQALVDEVVARR